MFNCFLTKNHNIPEYILFREYLDLHHAKIKAYRDHIAFYNNYFLGNVFCINQPSDAL